MRVFVCAAKLTSCSSMAVDVEAEVSATKRSQVEVTKILPEWTKEETRQSEEKRLDSLNIHSERTL